MNGCAITKEIETSTVIEDRSIDPRRSTRLKSVPAERDTQGIRNLDSTCYGICVLYTLVSLMKLYPELAKTKVLQKLKDMELRGKDNITAELSRSITEDIIRIISRTANTKEDKAGRRILEDKQQDSLEFLINLMSEDTETNEQGPILEQVFRFELINPKQCLCPRSEMVRNEGPNVNGSCRNFMYVGVTGREKGVTISSLIKYFLKDNSELDPISGGYQLELCERCQDPNPLGLRFKSAPKVLTVAIDRLDDGKAGRSTHYMKVDSYILMETEVRNLIYQIRSIICHKGNHLNGHYVTYTRDEENWWLYDDDKATHILNIGDQVCGKDVAMCYYIPTDHDSMPSENILIGVQRVLQVPNTRNQQSDSTRKRSKLR